MVYLVRDDDGDLVPALGLVSSDGVFYMYGSMLASSLYSILHTLDISVSN